MNATRPTRGPKPTGLNIDALRWFSEQGDSDKHRIMAWAVRRIEALEACSDARAREFSAEDVG